ncbi:DUF1573 domain-containing protein [Flavobacterium sp. DG1-102-2]|uniref:DUF1573 domain-containing protein n=1 Tax=Flavobacterium sp. DG1-102-2 TaxID=3081663 RepID=UPI00294A02C5|nr:DUF1573 domain-containing protein [Flavobacterium sp. DG1-102-2]MDV6170369.1 DUF1573 domain-containing protein [Flavobacterium sp. DG1-102-2]
MIRLKYTYTAAAALLVLTALNSCNKVGEHEITSIKIEDPVRHYSPVMQGTKQNITVKVTNTGDQPLVFKDVMPSCGCTIAKFPGYAIAPGNSADIELEYDSRKNTGYTSIYTEITANTAEKIHNVFFDINVVPNSHYIKDYEEIHLDSRNKIFDTTKDQIDEDTHIKAYTVN